MLEVDGPAAGLTAPFQPFPAQDWSDRATADFLKQVPHTQDQSIPLAPEHRMEQKPSQWSKREASGCDQHAGAGRGEKGVLQS